MQIGNIDVFLESITIASACNKLLRKRFLQPDTIGLIPAGWYTCNNNYRKEALVWLLHMEETDGVKIMHCRNGREYRLPELRSFNVDWYCSETRTADELFGCSYHGHTRQPFRDVTTMRGDTLAERYEQTMSLLKQIKRAGYLIKVQRECEFDDAGISAVQQSPLRTRDTLYGVRTEAMRLHHSICRSHEPLPVHMQVFQVPRRPSDHSRRRWV